jgi:hypothetical protein
MRNNNSAALPISAFDNIDYLSWMDTEIKLRLPGVVDTLPQITPNGEIRKQPGSSIVWVQRDDGQPTLLSQANFVTIDYLVLNSNTNLISKSLIKGI